MMWSMRRAIVVLAVTGLLGALSAWPIATAQLAVKPVPLPGGPGIDPNNPNEPNNLEQAITLPTDSKYKGKIDAAREYIKEENWQVAVTTLQSMLDLKEDLYVELATIDPD